ncbi:MAG TPA: DUF72 domain-containing protein [Chitinophagaceae bacterium]|nr:DUF72 domain-containing protein [Chitinophagaceae bacterium]
MSSANKTFYSGCSGLDLPVPRAQYPPEFEGKSRLAYYASLFNSIEINSIFYKLPRHSTVVNWALTVPDDFRFTFKVSKTITHVKNLDFAVKDVGDFIKTVENIGDKKGCLLAQFPPSLKIEKLDQLQNLLEALGEASHDTGWKLAMEFRNSSWYEREVYELLEEFNVSMVIHDIAASASPLQPLVGEFIYLRFHGPEPRYRGSYSNEYLQQYAEYIKQWIKEGKTVYVYFNNTVGDAVGNLITLNTYVHMNDNS